MNTKTFREILADKDDEFTYRVKSTVDIHHPERFERIRMTLMPFRIKTIVADGYSPLTKDNKIFPHEPNSPTFTVKIVTGLPVDTKRVLETMAMMLHIHQSHLYMAPEDDVASVLTGKPVEVGSETAQKLVGQKRIGEFMQELQQDRKEREKKAAVVREVYECFFTNHRSLETVVKKPMRKGYYMIEMSRLGDLHIMRAEGPFVNRPDGNPYRDRIGATAREIVSETDSGGLYGLQVLVERAPLVSAEKMFEVGVADMNSGRRYTSLVRAESAESAREIAVQQVAEAHRIDPTVLTAMAPKISEGIENPNSSGQGHDAAHANHPLHPTVTQHGYQYSHSTPIRHQDGSAHHHHTYQHPANPEHKVGVSDHDANRWDTTTSPASGRRMTGTGAEALSKHLILKSRRYGLR